MYLHVCILCILRCNNNLCALTNSCWLRCRPLTLALNLTTLPAHWHTGTWSPSLPLVWLCGTFIWLCQLEWVFAITAALCPLLQQRSYAHLRVTPPSRTRTNPAGSTDVRYSQQPPVVSPPCWVICLPAPAADAFWAMRGLYLHSALGATPFADERRLEGVITHAEHL